MAHQNFGWVFVLGNRFSVGGVNGECCGQEILLYIFCELATGTGSARAIFCVECFMIWMCIYGLDVLLVLRSGVAWGERLHQ